MTGLAERVDLGDLVRKIAADLEGVPLTGYLSGKTTIRDAVLAHGNCSMLEAEELVDTLELQGLIQFAGDPREAGEEPGYWTFEDPTGARTGQ